MAKSKYEGITEEINAKGEKQIYVIFQYQGVRYSKKNFTRLFGCKSVTEAYKVLQQVKVELSMGQDPFEAQKNTLNDYFDEMVDMKVKNGIWKYQTMLLNTRFYNKYMRKQIGWKRPSKITKEDLLKLMAEDMNGLHDHSKAKMRDILKPIIQMEMRKGNVKYNVLEELPKLNKQAVRESIRVRSLDSIDIIVKKLYRAIPYYRSYKSDEVHNFLYLNLMTAHRVGELRALEIKHFNLDKKICIAPASITKTGEPYRFPIPDEVIPYLRTIKSGKIFPTLSKSIDSIYRRLIEIADIDLVDGKRITAHDTRRFLLYCMVVKLGIDSMLADSCLNHKQVAKVADHYWNYSDEDINNSFHKYWEFIRDPEFEFTPVIKEIQPRRSKKEIEELREKGLIRPKNPNRDFHSERKRQLVKELKRLQEIESL